MSAEVPAQPGWRADQRSPERDEAARGLAGAAEIRRLLTRARNVAIVGLSADERRPSYFVAIYLKAEGYRIFPVNPRYAGGAILGRPVFASLRDIPEHIDVVDIFRKPSEVPPIVEDAIAIGADAVWMQLSVINEEAARRARAAGLLVVMDRCMKVEHGRHLGKMKHMGFSTGIISARRGRPGE
ncbi:MAG TPA: CoA-binding protein [Chloroflexota bacterium]|jgi:predicted CoA-binding protein|nr:CoA-binding protein [Chloroflexota bacterium]